MHKFWIFPQFIAVSGLDQSEPLLIVIIQGVHVDVSVSGELILVSADAAMTVAEKNISGCFIKILDSGLLERVGQTLLRHHIAHLT